MWELRGCAGCQRRLRVTGFDSDMLPQLLDDGRIVRRGLEGVGCVQLAHGGVAVASLSQSLGFFQQSADLVADSECLRSEEAQTPR